MDDQDAREQNSCEAQESLLSRAGVEDYLNLREFALSVDSKTGSALNINNQLDDLNMQQVYVTT